MDAPDFEKQILDEFKATAKSAWETLPPQAKADVLAAAKDVGQLMARRLRGEDVSQPLAEAKATLANYGVAGTFRVSETFWTVVDRVAKKAVELLAVFAKKAVLG